MSLEKKIQKRKTPWNWSFLSSSQQTLISPEFLCTFSNFFMSLVSPAKWRWKKNWALIHFSYVIGVISVTVNKIQKKGDSQNLPVLSSSQQTLISPKFFCRFSNFSCHRCYQCHMQKERWKKLGTYILLWCHQSHQSPQKKKKIRKRELPSCTMVILHSSTIQLMETLGWIILKKTC